MHCYCEILMPQSTVDVEKAIETIMAPFSENREGAMHSFWDWYGIGGRWSGEKYKSTFDADKISEFYNWLQEDKVTVSGITFGKQELQPASQVAKVDKKWNEMFPSEHGEQPCPLFKHSGDKMLMDVCKLSEVDPEKIEPERVIIAIPDFDIETKDWTDFDNMKAELMLSASVWNGVSHINTDWDGKLSSAIKKYVDRNGKGSRPNPDGDWLLVTVDYHS